MKQTNLIEYLDSLRGQGIPGSDCIVYKDHKEVFRHITGFADHKQTKPLTKNNTYWLYSASKVITCTAFMRLVDGGIVALDDPVSKYLPEYKEMMVKEGSGIRKAEKVMTIRHLLTMESGLNYDLGAPSIKDVLKEKGNNATTRDIIRALANEPLDFEPGTRYQYSLSHDVIGAVIEAVSGKGFGKYLYDHIFGPLGMENTGFKWTPKLKSNMSHQFMYDETTMTSSPMTLNNPYIFSDNYESGGAGLISTVDDYILFLDAMCNGGVNKEGYRVLSMESIDEMRKDQLGNASKEDFDLHGKIGYSYGLGVRTLIDKEISGARSPLGEFGWDGAAGAHALIDTDNRLAIFYAQHVHNCGFAYSVIHPTIRDLAYDMLGL